MSARDRRGRRGIVASLVAIAAGPLLYPLWLELKTRGAGRPRSDAGPPWPELLVVVPAYMEQEVIAAKVTDLRANGYPGELRILVVAEDAATAEAVGPGAEVLRPSERLGKARALNLGFAQGSEPIVAMTDADTRLEPGSLERLVGWFDDPAVAAVAGEKRVLGGGQGAYWRFESWLKLRESARGTTIGVVGELAAFRRSELQPLPADTAVDDLWLGLDVIAAGGDVAYEPEAVAVETAAPTLAEEWERRTRIQAGLVDLLVRRRGLLVPGSSRVAPELWGHKLVRAVVGPIAHLWLLLRALAAIGRSPVAAAFVAGHLLGLLGLRRESTGEPAPASARLAGQVLFLQASALGGLVRYARGDRPAIWPKRERGAGSREVFEPAATKE